METKSPRRIKALEILSKEPEGKFASELASQLGYSNSKEAGKMLNQLVLYGKLKSVREGAQQAATRVRYYDQIHEATALEKNRAGKGVTWGMGRATEKNKVLREAGFSTAKGKVLKTDRIVGK